MPPWNEICQVLADLRVLIQETEEEISDPVTTHERRLGIFFGALKSSTGGNNGQVWRCIPPWLGE